MREKIFTGIISAAITCFIINDFTFFDDLESATMWVGSFLTVMLTSVFIAASPLLLRKKFNYLLFQNLCLSFSFFLLTGHYLKAQEETAILNSKYDALLLQQINSEAKIKPCKKINSLVKKSLEQCANGDLDQNERNLITEMLKRDLIN
ncbi:MAG TPA: hypothetical protein VIC51_12645 [Psychromonas sp.]